ncbi:MAG: hypothetical protein ACREC8_10340, partial [Limisphaerales bacterium]
TPSLSHRMGEGVRHRRQDGVCIGDQQRVAVVVKERDRGFDYHNFVFLFFLFFLHSFFIDVCFVATGHGWFSKWLANDFERRSNRVEQSE